jgi:hypothetical protein
MNILRLCIDPGVSYLSWAYGFQAQLLGCGYYSLGKDLPKAAYNAQNFVKQFLFEMDFTPNKFVTIEKPVYEKNRAINHQNVLDLSLIVGACAVSENTIFITPNQWKGTCKKVIHQKRILPLLQPDELSVYENGKTRNKTLDHNIIDAIGILLWSEKRLKR